MSCLRKLEAPQHHPQIVNEFPSKKRRQKKRHKLNKGIKLIELKNVVLKVFILEYMIVKWVI